MPTRSLRFVLGSLSLAVLVSCSSTSEGSPKPAPTSDIEVETADPTLPTSEEGAEDSELPFAGAPKVDNPLDTTRFQQNPCQILSATQAQELNVETPGEQREASLGKACEYDSKADVSAFVEVAFFVKNPNGLSAVYQSNKDDELDLFEELEPIDGYPAVSWGQLDIREEGQCRVAVGVSDELVFDVVLKLSQANVGKKDPCETAAMVAGMALQTMKGDQ